MRETIPTASLQVMQVAGLTQDERGLAANRGRGYFTSTDGWKSNVPLLSALAVQALPNFLCDGEWCEHVASGPCPPLPKDSHLRKTRSQLQRQRDLEARRARGYADIRGTHASQAAAQLAAQAPADKDYDTDMDVAYESASMSASEGDSESEHDSESASESSSASESASESEI